MLKNNLIVAKTEQVISRIGYAIRGLRENAQLYNPELLYQYFLERSGVLRSPEEGYVDFIHKSFQELEEIGVKQDEMHLAVELLKKKKYNADTATRQEQQKMYGFLYRKGFRSDIICRALSLDITSFSV